MAGSHEVRGSIPLCSTTKNMAGLITDLPFFYVRPEGGSNPARGQQPSGLLSSEGVSPRSRSRARRARLPIPLCSTTKNIAGLITGLRFFYARNLFDRVCRR